MSEYIEREKALDAVVAWAEICPSTAISEIECMTAADAVPVVRGEWKTWEEQFPDKKVPKKNGLGVFCSVCQLHADNMFTFCPNCGAKMEV